jgi:translation initiation factor IF-2
LFSEQPKLQLVIKADVQGTLEAILSSMDTESTEVLRSGIGEVTEDDVEFAHTTKSLLLVFHTKVSRQLEEKAKAMGVRLKRYDVIYQLIEDLQKLMLKLLEPTIDEEVHAEADVLQIFNMRGEHIAGCRILSGKLLKADKVHIQRGGRTVADGEVRSIMQGKQEVSEVTAGEECGVTLKQKRVEMKPGDHLVFYQQSSKW